jgi:GNAT superfamily N-acetyltransferase
MLLYKLATRLDWEQYKILRLRALADAPDAFCSIFEAELDQPDEFWTRRIDCATATILASFKEDGLGLVTIASYAGEADALGLYGMWVATSARGTSVASDLVDRAVEQARRASAARLLLDVGDENLSAVKLYERKRFIPTGLASTMPAPKHHITLHQRVLTLSSSSLARAVSGTTSPRLPL